MSPTKTFNILAVMLDPINTNIDFFVDYICAVIYKCLSGYWIHPAFCH